MAFKKSLHETRESNLSSQTKMQRFLFLTFTAWAEYPVYFLSWKSISYFIGVEYSTLPLVFFAALYVKTRLKTPLHLSINRVKWCRLAARVFTVLHCCKMLLAGSKGMKWCNKNSLHKREDELIIVDSIFIERQSSQVPIDLFIRALYDGIFLRGIRQCEIQKTKVYFLPSTS